MRSLRRALAASLLVLPVLVLRPVPAAAHPLGNFTVNTSARIVVLPERVELTHVVDMAEIPTFQELGLIDADGDGSASAAEVDAWGRRRAGELLADLSLVVDGMDVALSTVSSTAELRPGQGGLGTLRLETRYAGDVPTGGEAEFVDRTFRGRAGWREVVVTTSGGAMTTASSAPTESPSAALTSYPQDLLSSPLNVTRAAFSFSATGGGLSGPGGSGVVPGDGTSSAVERAGTDGGLAGLLANADRTTSLVALSLLIAFGFGALHAMGPGHGKTLVAAYLVGADRRLRHATAVGVAVAAMHTASVLALGVAIMLAGRSFAPEVAYPWFGTVAGAVAVVLGGSLLATRLRRGPASDEHRHPHADDHEHAHPHERVHANGELSWRTMGSIALAGGILPSPSALLTLLAAVALGRVPFGLALIGAFSLGLAGALVVVGAVAVRTRHAVSRRLSGRWERVVPIGSAAAILTVGLVMVARGVLSL
jgi:ABC-type nickel/cobalt efflux system permease component RcnA